MPGQVHDNMSWMSSDDTGELLPIDFALRDYITDAKHNDYSIVVVKRMRACRGFSCLQLGEPDSNGLQDHYRQTIYNVIYPTNLLYLPMRDSAFRAPVAKDDEQRLEDEREERESFEKLLYDYTAPIFRHSYMHKMGCKDENQNFGSTEDTYAKYHTFLKKYVTGGERAHLRHPVYGYTTDSAHEGGRSEEDTPEPIESPPPVTVGNKSHKGKQAKLSQRKVSMTLEVPIKKSHKKRPIPPAIQTGAVPSGQQQDTPPPNVNLPHAQTDVCPTNIGGIPIQNTYQPTPRRLNPRRDSINAAMQAENREIMSKFLSYLCWRREEGEGREGPQKVLSEHFTAELSVWLKCTHHGATRDKPSQMWVGSELSQYSKLGEAQTGISESMTLKPWNARGRRVDYANLEGWLRKQDTFDESALEDLDCASMLAQVAEICQCKKCTHPRNTAGVVIQTGTSGVLGP